MIISLVSLITWGWLNQNILAAAIMSALILSSLISTWRWQLKVAQFYRIGDWVTASFIVVLLLLSFIQTEQRPVFIILEWLPVFFLPVLLVQLFCINQQLPIGILFYSMRKREQVSTLDFKIPYAVICLLAAGAVNSNSLDYFVLSIAIISVILWSARSKNSPVLLWFLVLFSAIGMAFLGQQELRKLHSLVEELSVEWLSDWQTDPFKSMTSIGDIGELKLSNKIEFRVKASEPLLLLQSSYDRYLGQSWLASERVFNSQNNYVKAEKNSSVKTIEVFQSRKRATILALPSGTTNIQGLEGGELQFTALGAVKLTEAPDFVNYTVSYTGKLVTQIRDFDLQVPKQHLAWIKSIQQELNLEGQAPSVIAQSIKQYFQKNYHYSLFLGKESNPNKALENFILKRKAGHCEYFAVASTLLLRSYGIPARLANGYAMQEYSDIEQLYIVRRRHAHAWSIAQIAGAWQAVDSTPSQWLALEEEQTDIWQPVYDLFSSLYFNYKQWRFQQALLGHQSDKTLGLSIAGLLFLLLCWRLYKSRKLLLKQYSKSSAQTLPIDYPGKDSELYLIEQSLVATHKQRKQNEPINIWAKRIGDSELIEIASLHNHYRFDTLNFSDTQRKTLKTSVEKWLKQP